MKSTHIETVAIHGGNEIKSTENTPIVPGIEMSTFMNTQKESINKEI